MNDLNPELQINPQPPSDTPTQVIEQEAALPVAEGDDKKDTPRVKTRAKAGQHRKNPVTPKHNPPEVSGVFLSEEDERMLKKMNQIMINRLGIKKNNSFKI